MMSIIYPHLCYRGFTLIEMVISITVLAILAGATSIFLQGPITSYFDAERRASLADAGELAMAKLSEDISNAVPGSVRVANAGGAVYIEFLPVVSQGIYCNAAPCAALSFGLPSTQFDVMGAPPNSVAAQAGDWVVVNNYLATPGVNDVWAGNARAAYAGPSGNVDTIIYTSHTFTLSSTDHRFQLTSGPVTYACAPTAVGGTITRYTGYPINPVQPASPAALAGSQANLLATGLTSCSASFSRGTRVQAGWLAMAMGFISSGDVLNVYDTFRVDPLP